MASTIVISSSSAKANSTAAANTTPAGTIGNQRQIIDFQAATDRGTGNQEHLIDDGKNFDAYATDDEDHETDEGHGFSKSHESGYDLENVQDWPECYLEGTEPDEVDPEAYDDSDPGSDGARCYESEEWDENGIHFLYRQRKNRYKRG
ncbi:hypothetical protein FSPOR_7126 [Fusarium sporotrichioides]|uniref:Uncharacterized protein n=1 Tax=Fusarium sporotrichioides TaxID=5514 RepID=A0A395S0V2_FUSSP|nr:hypothetical protein FSPOR_7126 [Fusarium sporotrichioides]